MAKLLLLMTSFASVFTVYFAFISLLNHLDRRKLRKEEDFNRGYVLNPTSNSFCLICGHWVYSGSNCSCTCSCHRVAPGVPLGTTCPNCVWDVNGFVCSMHIGPAGSPPKDLKNEEAIKILARSHARIKKILEDTN